ncbi:MAG: BamA/TamA family outer membrane protein, partial [Deltaproteobacteria bacterium]|nr:BamA/TamA family outer membrane protein [Deltaproteobacteria bacterium]
LRGFTDNGLCRYDKDGKLDPTCPDTFGGNVLVNGSLELRVPLFKLWIFGFWAGAFFDAGALAEDHAKLYAASFRFSAGLGLRILVGDLVPVRFDVGFPVFERRCVAYTTDGACVREKPSQFNFGFLYTF